LITGDAGGSMLGRPSPPDIGEDNQKAAESFMALSTLDFDVAVFGHGKPITAGASERFRKAVKAFSPSTSQVPTGGLVIPSEPPRSRWRHGLWTRASESRPAVI
jgi:hypothetical protein